MEVVALALRTRSEGKDKTVVCSHCKRTGHESDSCFALIGYPEWWGDRPRSDGKTGGRGRGHPGGQGGRGGGRGGRGMNRAYAAQAGGGTSTNATTTESNATPLPGFNLEQWQRFLQMLGESKPATTEKMTGKHEPWIIDTGASNHMTGTIGDLRDLKEIA